MTDATVTGDDEDDFACPCLGASGTVAPGLVGRGGDLSLTGPGSAIQGSNVGLGLDYEVTVLAWLTLWPEMWTFCTATHQLRRNSVWQPPFFVKVSSLVAAPSRSGPSLWPLFNKPLPSPGTPAWGLWVKVCLKTSSFSHIPGNMHSILSSSALCGCSHFQCC